MTLAISTTTDVLGFQLGTLLQLVATATGVCGAVGVVVGIHRGVGAAQGIHRVLKGGTTDGEARNVDAR